VVSSLRYFVQNFVCICILFWEPGGQIGAVTWLWAKQQRQCILYPAGKLPNRICGPPSLSFNGYRWLFLGGKDVGTWRPSLLSNSEFTINWIRTFTFAPLHAFVVCIGMIFSHPCMLQTPQICIQPVTTCYHACRLQFSMQICITEIRVRITAHRPTSPAVIFTAFLSSNLTLSCKSSLPYPLKRIACDDPDIPNSTHLTQHWKQIRK